MREAGDRDRTSTSLHSARTAPRLEFFQIPRWPLPASMAMTRAPPETTTNPSSAISKSRPVRYLTTPITKPPAPPIPPKPHTNTLKNTNSTVSNQPETRQKPHTTKKIRTIPADFRRKKLFGTMACNHLSGSVSSPCTSCAEPLPDLSAAQQVDPTDKPNREPGLIPADCHADHVSDHMTRASGAHFLFSMGVNSVCSVHLTEVFLRADLNSSPDPSNCRQFGFNAHTRSRCRLLIAPEHAPQDTPDS